MDSKCFRLPYGLSKRTDECFQTVRADHVRQSLPRTDHQFEVGSRPILRHRYSQQQEYVRLAGAFLHGNLLAKPLEVTVNMQCTEGTTNDLRL